MIRIIINDTSYEVLRTIQIDPLDPHQTTRILGYKNSWNYDKLIKNDNNGLFYICNEIEEASIINVENSI